MAILTIPQLKALWIDGFIPDQNDYADLFDSIEALGDPNALSLDTASQIQGLLLKAAPVGADVAIIEDSEDGFSKKRILLSTLLGGGSTVTNTSELINDGSDGTSVYVEQDELGTAASSDASDFATAAQGALAASAIQAGDLASVATSGDYNDLINQPNFVENLVAGANITIDSSDPANPIISASGGGGSFTGSQGINLVGNDFQLGGIIDTEAEITINETVNEEESLTFSGTRQDGGSFTTIISPAGFFAQTTDGSDGTRSSIQSDNNQASLTALGDDFSGRVIANGDTRSVSIISTDNGMTPEETSIILNPDGMFIKTPAVESGTATATQVLSLVNAVTGEVEFATVSGGGGGDLLAANNLSDVADSATALSNLGGASLSASNTFTGVINTFNNLVEVTSHIALTGTGGTAQAGKIFFAPITTPSGTGTGSGNSQLSAGSNGELVWLGSGNAAAIFDNSAITDARTYGLPDADGTIALTSDIPSTANFVTTDSVQTINVNKTFGSSANVTIERFLIVGNSSSTSGNDGKILLTKRTASPSGVGDGTFTQIYADIDGAFTVRASGKNDTIFDPVNITAQRRYTLPDADGTLALLSDVPSAGDFMNLTSSQTAAGTKTFSGAISVSGTGIFGNGSNFIQNFDRISGVLHDIVGGAGIWRAEVASSGANMQISQNSGSFSGGDNVYLFQGDGSFDEDDNVARKKNLDAAVADLVDLSTAQTISGDKTFTGQNQFQGPIVTPPTILSSVAGVIDWTGQEGSSYEITLTEDTVWNNPSAPIDNSEMRIRIRQDGTGLHTLTFGSNFNFPGGVAPSITPDPNAKDYLTIVVDGTDLDAVEVQNFL